MNNWHKKQKEIKIKWNRMKLSYIIWISLKILMDNIRKKVNVFRSIIRMNTFFFFSFKKRN